MIEQRDQDWLHWCCGVFAGAAEDAHVKLAEGKFAEMWAALDRMEMAVNKVREIRAKVIGNQSVPHPDPGGNVAPRETPSPQPEGEGKAGGHSFVDHGLSAAPGPSEH